MPTILDHVTPGMPVFDEETFGPVAAIIRVPDAEAAVRLANETNSALALHFGPQISSVPVAWCAGSKPVQCSSMGWSRRTRACRSAASRILAMGESSASTACGNLPTSKRFGSAQAGTPNFGPEWKSTMNSDNAHEETTRRGTVVDVDHQPIARGNGNRTIPLIGPRSGACELINGITRFPGRRYPRALP